MDREKKSEKKSDYAETSSTIFKVTEKKLHSVASNQSGVCFLKASLAK